MKKKQNANKENRNNAATSSSDDKLIVINDKFYPIFFLILLGCVLFFMIRAFIPGIISAFAISLFMLPLFRIITKKIPKKLAAFFIILSIILLLFVVIYFVSQNLIDQATQYLNEQEIRSTLDIFLKKFKLESSIIGSFLELFLSKIKDILVGLSLSVASGVPAIAINVLVAFFIAYYLLVYWDDFVAFIIKSIPFKNEKLLIKMKKSFYSIFYGLSIIAIIEFFISLIGFSIAGVKLSLFLALLIGIAAFIPFFGPIAVWLPLFAYYILSGNIYSSVVVFITGLVLTVGVENLLTPIIIGKTSKINPVFMILGVLGGVSLFGIFGVIVGPLIIIIFINFFEQYLENLNRESS